MKGPSLKTLFQSHDGLGSDKWSSYIDIYDHALRGYRTRPIDMLEIGIQNGGSLEIWAKYFPKARAIVGCDINTACESLSFSDPRISVVIGDAGEPETARKIGRIAETFDIVIDDGSHLSGDIIRSLALYFPRLKGGGLYIIEDLHCSYWPTFGGGLYDDFSANNFLKLLADVVNVEHWSLEKSVGKLFSEFSERHDVNVVDSFRDGVFSVSFYNSICIISKGREGKSGLGHRMIVGKHFYVATPIKESSLSKYALGDEDATKQQIGLATTVVRPRVVQFQESPFNEGEYLEANPDVAAAVKEGGFRSGREHYEKYGAREGRMLKR